MISIMLAKAWADGAAVREALRRRAERLLVSELLLLILSRCLTAHSPTAKAQQRRKKMSMSKRQASFFKQLRQDGRHRPPEPLLFGTG